MCLWNRCKIKNINFKTKQPSSSSSCLIFSCFLLLSKLAFCPWISVQPLLGLFVPMVSVVVLVVFKANCNNWPFVFSSWFPFLRVYVTHVFPLYLYLFNSHPSCFLLILFPLQQIFELVIGFNAIGDNDWYISRVVILICIATEFPHNHCQIPWFQTYVSQWCEW